MNNSSLPKRKDMNNIYQSNNISVKLVIKGSLKSPIAVSMRAARTLLKRLTSENLNLSTQFALVPRHPGTNSLFTK